MATKVPTDEKFEKQDLNLFDVLAKMDAKDYGYFDTLSEEQQKKFVPYMMTHWMSAIKGSHKLQGYYVRSTDYYANVHLFNENVQKHPKLQWLMLCASSASKGKQFHQWIPHLSTKIASLKESAKQKEVTEYFTKIYPKANPADITDISKVFVKDQNKKAYLAKVFPNLKINDIETLAQVITDKDIEQYEKDRGN
jgi:hypothetical protein